MVRVPLLGLLHAAAGRAAYAEVQFRLPQCQLD